MSLYAIAEACHALAVLLEKTAPKGLRHPKHAQHVAPARKRIKAVMVHFFERQRRAVLADVRPKIKRELVLYPNVKEASANGKTFARSIVPASLHPLTFSATAGETSEYDDAITDLIAAAAETLGAVEGATNYASTYLRENSLSKLTGGLDSTSTERLQNAIADAWDKAGSFNDIVKSIEDTFDDFSTKRAEMIAQTEANDAYNSARSGIAESLGYDEKRWDPDGEACPECQGNADQDWIDIGDDFSSGDDAPTAHPNCDCSLDFRKSSGDDEDEG